MNKLAIMILAAFAMLMNSCGEPTTPKTSSEFQRLCDDVKAIENTIMKISDCGDFALQDLAIMGLDTDLENYAREGKISDAELEQLNVMIDELKATRNGRWATLDCDRAIGEEELDTSGEEAGDYPD